MLLATFGRLPIAITGVKSFSTWVDLNPASTRSARRGDQEEVLLNHVYELMLALSGHATPVTLLRYPKLVRDKAYCYAKLRPILGSIEFDDFARAFDATARPDLVHSFAANDA